MFAAPSAGAIDRAKAWVFADHLADLPAHQATAICTALLPVAPGLTTGQLRARLARMLHDIDPEYARRRYQQAVRERTVIDYLAPDGTVTIAATGLPADEAAVACERLDVLAHAVQRAGHPGRLSQIQTDLFLGMLDGSFHHLSQPEIVAALLDRSRPADREPTAPPEPTQSTEPTQPMQPTQSTDARTTPEARSPAPAEPRADAAAWAQPRTGIEIRVGLTTLLGLDECCGEVPGPGPVLPEVARTLVTAQHRGGEWRFAITDADGQLLLAGTTRRRPAPPAAARGRRRGGIVELHIDAHTLTRLTADPPCGPWSGIITDLADQYARSVQRATPLDQRPGDRFARSILARHIEVRDRTCCFPGCRRPARKADKDHTRDHAAGGPTASDHIGPLCGRHHRYKSHGWWTLAQPEPGRFHWTSPLGHRYRTRGEPLRPPTVPPHPRPATNRDTSSPRRTSGPILTRRPGPPARTEPATPADDPPF